LESIAVVGASLAGLRAVETLRREGFDGRLTLIGAEPHLPYDRPPLSKVMLAGEWDEAKLSLRTSPYEDLDLDLRLGTRAAGLDLDPARRAVLLDDGGRVDADGILLATGSQARTMDGLPGSGLDGAEGADTVDDARDIATRLDSSPRVVVVGAGFIGSEVAATCRGRGLDVTVLEALPQPMVRGLGPMLGAVCAQLHRDHGVDLHLGAGVEGFEGDGRVERVRLVDGRTVEADLVIVGIGVVPATGWLEGSGLTLDNGVVCDATLRAAPDVVAAGDVCRWPNPLFDDELMRLEHWTNAAEQGVAAALRLLRTGVDEAGAEPFAPVPFVWSDQYDVKIQSAGRFTGEDEVAIVHGTTEEYRFVALFGRAGRLIGALAFSRPRNLMQYRRMIFERTSFAAALEHAHAAG
jgi:NADPH-dependent 2,4-dienoyl-CoA reductase/sulfur reductase-like enzyme